MCFLNQIIITSLCFLISFIFLRGFLYGIKQYKLNNSAYKKRKKDETIKEWFFYSRYKDVLPKFLLYFYYFNILMHLLIMIVCILSRMMNLSCNVGGTVAIVIACYDALWIVVIALLFWSPGRAYAYERWISKNANGKR